MNNQTNKLAKLSGLIYILIAISGGFAFFAAYESLIVPNNAYESIQNIKESEFTFRLGILGDSIVFILEIILSVFLYKIFKSSNNAMALIATASRLIMTSIIGFNVINKLIVLELISGDSYLSSFTSQQLDTLAFMFLKAYGYTTLIWGVFFALHLLIIGNLICKSNLFPKVFAMLFTFAGLAYAINSIGLFIAPQHTEIYNIIIMLSIPAELSFALWLLIKGTNKEE